MVDYRATNQLETRLREILDGTQQVISEMTGLLERARDEVRDRQRGGGSFFSERRRDMPAPPPGEEE
jgi:hypothetical protein